MTRAPVSARTPKNARFRGPSNPVASPTAARSAATCAAGGEPAAPPRRAGQPVAAADALGGPAQVAVHDAARLLAEQRPQFGAHQDGERAEGRAALGQRPARQLRAAFRRDVVDERPPEQGRVPEQLGQRDGVPGKPARRLEGRPQMGPIGGDPPRGRAARGQPPEVGAFDPVVRREGGPGWHVSTAAAARGRRGGLPEPVQHELDHGSRPARGSGRLQIRARKILAFARHLTGPFRPSRLVECRLPNTSGPPRHSRSRGAAFQVVRSLWPPVGAR